MQRAMNHYIRVSVGVLRVCRLWKVIMFNDAENLLYQDLGLSQKYRRQSAILFKT
jgi:hypothetical protein